MISAHAWSEPGDAEAGLLNADVAGDLAVLDALRAHLAGQGVRAELREHLLSLVVFAAAPAMPLCVFVTADGLSWHAGRQWHPATDLAGAAARIAACAQTAAPGRAVPPAAGRVSSTSQGEPHMAEQACALLRVMTSESSWECTRTYPATRDQVRHVRTFARRLLDGFPAADDAVLMLSELAANAVLHSRSSAPGGTFNVRLAVYEGEHICAEVRDDGGLWTARPGDDSCGRGLSIVCDLASAWGREGAPNTGWTVWFRLDWPAPEEA